MTLIESVAKNDIFVLTSAIRGTKYSKMAHQCKVGLYIHIEIIFFEIFYKNTQV